MYGERHLRSDGARAWLIDLVQVTPPDPTDPLLTMEEATLHLRVDFNDDFTLIAGLVAAATAWLDGWSGILGRALVTQTWRLYFDHGFPEQTIRLPLPPLIGVTSIQYVDINGATQTVSPADYQVLDGPRAAVRPVYGQIWPVTLAQARACWIEFECGYGAASEVPAAIKAAALLMISHLYFHRDAVVGVEQRDSSTPLPLGVAELLGPYRGRF